MKANNKTHKSIKEKIKERRSREIEESMRRVVESGCEIYDITVIKDENTSDENASNEKTDEIGDAGMPEENNGQENSQESSGNNEEEYDYLKRYLEPFSKSEIYTDRILYLYGEINQESAMKLTKEIIQINAEDSINEKDDKNHVRKPISLYICSDGGNIRDMWFIIDTIQTSETPINTFCFGYAREEAFVVFLAGKDRYVSAHAFLTYTNKIHDEKGRRITDGHEFRDISDFILNQTQLGYVFYNSGKVTVSSDFMTNEMYWEKGVINGVL